MMFDKNNTNYNGECLCLSCMNGFALETKTGVDIMCSHDCCIVKNVGVCNKYVEVKHEL